MLLVSLIRLSTTLDEVIVYPIPAALYLVKNLLQVGCMFPVRINKSCIVMASTIHCYVAVLYICICGCPGLSNTEEPEYYQHWSLIQNHTKEEVSHFYHLCSSLPY